MGKKKSNVTDLKYKNKIKLKINIKQNLGKILGLQKVQSMVQNYF